MIDERRAETMYSIHMRTLDVIVASVAHMSCVTYDMNDKRIIFLQYLSIYYHIWWL